MHYRQIDVESNVDLLQAFVDFDYDYVSSLFLQHRKTEAAKKSLASKPSTQAVQDEDDDQVSEPNQSLLLQHRLDILKQTESFLVRRIAQANFRRRQQFAYWKNHRDKLSKHSAAATKHVKFSEDPKGDQILTETDLIKPLPVAIGSEALSVTTASHLQIPQRAISDEESQASVSEYAPTISNHDQETVDFPPVPKRPLNEKFFECPCCFTMCPKAVLREKAWK